MVEVWRDRRIVPAKTGVLLEAEVGTKIDLNFTDKVSCMAKGLYVVGGKKSRCQIGALSNILIYR